MKDRRTENNRTFIEACGKRGTAMAVPCQRETSFANLGQRSSTIAAQRGLWMHPQCYCIFPIPIEWEMSTLPALLPP